MLKRMNPIVAVAMCGLALGLLAAPRAHATPKTIAQAQAAPVEKIGVLAFVDTEAGTDLDDNASGVLADQIANSVWSILNNGSMVISKDGKDLYTAVVLSNREWTHFLVHGRTKNTIVDGQIYRGYDTKDPNRGFSELFVTMLAEDGKSSVTAYIFVPLTFTQ